MIIEDSDSVSFMENLYERSKEIEQHSNLIKNGQITPTVLIYATSKYYANASFLTMMYEEEMLKDKGLQQDFKIVWSQWYLASAKELNETRIKSKYANASEIEAKAILDNKEEWKKWQNKLIISERTVSFYRRLKEDWKDVLQILIQLNANARGEMKALFAENYIEAIGKPKKIPKRG